MNDLHADLVECLPYAESLAKWCEAQADDPDNKDGAVTLLAIAETLRNADRRIRTHRDELLGVVEGWRPIDELRSAAVVVLFHIPGKSLPVMARADDYHSGFAHWLEGTTHWRPLPAPPAIDAARHGRGE